MFKPIASLNYDLYVDCPKCKNDFDLIEKNDDDKRMSGPLFLSKWEELEDLDVVCDHCDHEFQIKKVIY